MTNPATFGGSNYPPTTAIEALADLSRDFPAAADRIDAILRAVPSPDTVGVREALEAVRGDVVTAIAFLNRDAGTDRIHPTARSIASQLAEADKRILTALARLSPSHCTAGRRREEIAKIVLKKFLGLEVFPTKEWEQSCLDVTDAIFALTSKQSGPTAGREELEKSVARLRDYASAFDGDDNVDDSEPNLRKDVETVCFAALSPSPPERQQDQDETSVLLTDYLNVLRHLQTAWGQHNGVAKINSDDLSALEEVYKLLASPPVSGASREALEKCRDAIRTLYFRIDNSNMPACLAAAWEAAEVALNNSFDKTGGAQNIGTYIDDNADDGR